MQVLHLFACRLAWLRHGDQRAHRELIRASEHGDPEIRVIAAVLLVDLPIAPPNIAVANMPVRFDPNASK